MAICFVEHVWWGEEDDLNSAGRRDPNAVLALGEDDLYIS